MVPPTAVFLQDNEVVCSFFMGNILEADLRGVKLLCLYSFQCIKAEPRPLSRNPYTSANLLVVLLGGITSLNQSQLILEHIN